LIYHRIQYDRKVSAHIELHPNEKIPTARENLRRQ
jgi:hypothetical protein